MLRSVGIGNMVNDYKIKKVYLILTLLLWIFSAQLSAQSITDKSKWVDSVFQQLSIEQRIGQLMMIPVYASGNQEHYSIVKQHIENHAIGGVIFMQGGPVAQAKLINELQEISRVPLLVAMDAEWGLGMRLDSTISYPIAMALGAIRNDTLIQDIGKAIGEQMQLVGAHMNFAPVVDVNSNPNNPVIGMRAYSDDPEVVWQKARAFKEGMKEAGILTVVKHFPGHGDTQVDSHLSLPVLKSSEENLYKRELYPFKKFADDTVDAIMIGHLYAPSLANDGLPVTLSDKVIKSILRDEWNYDGLLVTDALNMGAIAANYKKGQAEELALKAGNDILLFPEDIQAAVRKIKRALRKNKIKEDEFNESVKRVLQAKYDANLHKSRSIDTANLLKKINAPKYEILKREAISSSTSLLKNDILPLDIVENRSYAYLSIGNSTKEVLREYLAKYASFYTLKYEKENITDLKNLGFFDVVVAGIYSSRLDEEQLNLLYELEQRTDLIIVAMGSPYKLKSLGEFSNIIWSPEQSTLYQQTLAEQIFGAKEFMGQLPVNVGSFERGAGVKTNSLNRLSFSVPENAGIDSDVLGQIDEIAREAIKDRATPGMQILIAKDGKVVWNKNYGHQTYDSIYSVSDQTIYDLASITKVAASVQAIMFLYERGLIDLDKKISIYLPDLIGTNKENMSLRDILTHQAGLWPYLPFYKTTLIDDQPSTDFYRFNPELGYVNQVSSSLYTAESIADSVWNWVKDSKLREKEPNIPYDYKYSDMGYYIIQRIANKLLNQPMDEFLNQNLYDPLGATTLTYRPLCEYPVTRIAPTEMDTYFRYELVCGHVHDQGAALLGGVAGHAGLFSNALDLAKLMQLMLQKGKYGGMQFYQPETIELFTQKQYESNRRGLGWDKPVTDDYGGPTSNLVSSGTFGHTGFTGTAAWVDPEFNLVYIFLSNRVYPDATNTKLISSNVRTRIQDVIYEAIFEYRKFQEIQ